MASMRRGYDALSRVGRADRRIADALARAPTTARAAVMNTVAVRAQSSDAKTHFGFQTVDESKKADMVGDVFKRVAENYDLMNDLMSGTMHRFWKDEFVRMAGPIASRGEAQTICLDVAGGTGDIAFRIVDRLKQPFNRPLVPPHVIVCDINPAMLKVGQQRAVQLGYAGGTDPDAPQLSWVEGDAEALPIASDSVDLFTIAFGIRNVTHVDQAVREAFRVLKPGGRFMCLEFSKVENPLMRQFYDMYSFNVIPTMGQLVANDRDSYQYLVESIRKFPDQEAFADMIRGAGFSHVKYTNFTFGVCAVHSGFKL